MQSSLFRSRAYLFFVALLLLVCLMLYLPGLKGPLFFDDIPNLELNPVLATFSALEADAWRQAALSSDSGLFYRPLSMLTFAINLALSHGEFSALALKLTNWLLHLLMGGAIYRLSLMVLRSPVISHSERLVQEAHWIALAATAIWLLHPLHVSTVLYVVQRMAQLSALFVLLGLGVFLHFRLRWAVRVPRSGEVLTCCAWIVVFAVLATLSKENGLVLIPLIPVVELCLFRGRWAGADQPRVEYVLWALIVLAIVFAVLLWFYPPAWLSSRYLGRPFSLDERLLTQTRVLWQYVSWYALPSPQTLGFFHDDIAISVGWLSPWTTALSTLAWCVSLISAFLFRGRWPLLLFTLLFYLVSHSIESSFWPLEMVFEHRNYLPSAFLALPFAVAMFAVGDAAKAIARPQVWMLLVLSVLCFQTGMRSFTWGSEIELSRASVSAHPQSSRSNHAYGVALYKTYLESEQGELTEKEKAALLLVSYDHFLRAHSLSQDQLSSLVMLYQLEKAYFPDLDAAPNRLQAIANVVSESVLQASDREALKALVAMSSALPWLTDRDQISAVLGRLETRWPRSQFVIMLRYQMIASSPSTEEASLLYQLSLAQSAAPSNLATYPHLVETYGATGNYGAAYQALADWLAADKLRKSSGKIKRILTP